ncbi:unnamed protein product [Vitrella brassicaformis CCMP3155]|uniref:RAP domain-containing protein n=1 Tax=Vitrella brassicaformis (strain CCMP3155) TaxID=1169540 RepID=A0A0G4EM12_VITBC|nr:unnamed protein product [Vitrella brassicaformis CCMP3155]|eukprot:CEL98017.1 unnamed protein product [Vitrella brassicaformis CCMP3155]
MRVPLYSFCHGRRCFASAASPLSASFPTPPLHKGGRVWSVEEVESIFGAYRRSLQRPHEAIETLKQLGRVHVRTPIDEVTEYKPFQDLVAKLVGQLGALKDGDLDSLIRCLQLLRPHHPGGGGSWSPLGDRLLGSFHRMSALQVAELSYLLAVPLKVDLDRFFFYALNARMNPLVTAITSTSPPGGHLRRMIEQPMSADSQPDATLPVPLMRPSLSTVPEDKSEAMQYMRQPSRLSRLLHYFAHPSMRRRVTFFTNPALIDFIHARLPDMGADDQLRLLQLYSTLPGAAQLVEGLLKHLTSDIKSVSVPGLVNVAEGIAVMAGSSHEDEGATSRGEMVKAVTDRVTELTKANQVPLDALARITTTLEDHVDSFFLDAIAPTLTQGLQSSPSLPPTTILARLLLQYAALPDTAVSSALMSSLEKAVTHGMLIGALTNHADLLARLALTFVSVAREEETYSAVRQAAMTAARKGTLTPRAFSEVIVAMAVVGYRPHELLEAYQLDVKVARVPLVSMPTLVWGLALMDAEREGVWRDIFRRLAQEADEFGEEELAYLYEGLKAAAIMGMLEGTQDTKQWKSFIEGTCRRAWESVRGGLAQQQQQQQDHRSPPTSPPYADMLTHLKLHYQTDVPCANGLYLKPFVLDESRVVIDPTPNSPYHLVSKNVLGEIAMRHRVWKVQGYNPLLVVNTLFDAYAPTAAPTTEAEGAEAEGEGEGREEWDVAGAAKKLKVLVDKHVEKIRRHAEGQQRQQQRQQREVKKVEQGDKGEEARGDEEVVRRPQQQQQTRQQQRQQPQTRAQQQRQFQQQRPYQQQRPQQQQRPHQQQRPYQQQRRQQPMADDRRAVASRPFDRRQGPRRDMVERDVVE